ncbi:MAG: helix-turn-helix domain-containing protein [Gemmatimonadetes bacterium]|nr:MAG: helix-turn-helix domain-containing protein [Gemmatimonadota bacterium]
MAALRASKLLRRLLARWERILVSEALDAGTTWEELGRALGVTRQAVWSRFRSSGR